MFTIDQQSSGLNFARNYDVPAGAYAGQEFVPAGSSLNAVDLDVVTRPGNLPATAQVRIRLDTITGTVVGNSEPVWLTWPPPAGGGPSQPLVRFDFAPAIAVEPGVRHVIEIVPLSGAVVTLSVFSDSGHSYPGGRMIMDGVPDDSTPIEGKGRLSLRFAEGFDDGLGWRAMTPEQVFLFILGGVTAGGPGIGILPGGKPVPIPPHGPRLHPFTRRALTGLAVREIASFIEDADIRRAVEQAGVTLVKRALEQLPPEG